MLFKEKCNELGDWGQRVLREYNEEVNESRGLFLDTLTHGSNQKASFTCEKCGNTWDATISHRIIQKSGCPICAGQKIHTGFNDLQTVCPELAKEYHPTLNSKPVTEVSATWYHKVYWQCPKCGYGENGEWEAAIGRRRAKGYETACPKCGYFWKTGEYKKNISHKLIKGKNDFKTRCLNNGEFGKKLIEEFDVEENLKENKRIEDLAYRSNKKMHWKCKKGHKWVASVVSRTYNYSNCPICSKTGVSLSEKFIYNALSSIIPNMEHNYKIPQRLGGYELDICLPDQKLVIEYDGSFWHSTLNEDGTFPKDSREAYKTEVCKQVGLRLIHIYDGGDTEEPFIINDIIIFSRNENRKYDQLKSVIQLILKELNIEDTIDYKVIEEYTIRTYSSIPYEDSLAYNFPELLEEWDYEENTTYTPETISAKSKKKVHWICKKCHQRWQAEVYNRAFANNKCPICRNKKIIKGINDLQSQYPELAKEWHPTLNSIKPSEIKPGSNKIVHWQCQKCGYGEHGEWKSMVYTRSRKGHEIACPKCGYFWKTGGYKRGFWL